MSIFLVIQEKLPEKIAISPVTVIFKTCTHPKIKYSSTVWDLHTKENKHIL